MKSNLELALECAVNIYHRYALKHPIDDYLSRSEFSLLLKENAQPFLHRTVPPNVPVNDYINNLFAKADRNRDGRLKFTEFLTTLTRIAIDAHKEFHHHEGTHQGHDHGHDHGHEHGPSN
ncbi:protein S100-A7-like [Porphyrio hochstetteri]